MEEVIKKIKEKIAACKQTGDMFNLLSLPDRHYSDKTECWFSWKQQLYHE